MAGRTKYPYGSHLALKKGRGAESRDANMSHPVTPVAHEAQPAACKQPLAEVLRKEAK